MKQSDRIALLVLSGLAALAGCGLMFSTYMMYDDEGYVLFSLKNFVEGGGLYDRVFSQYGPFFFLWNQGLHLAGHDFSHTSGRLVTLAYWFAATGCCAALVWRWTRSTAATACALAGVFLHLWPLINEPSHPGGLIVLLVTLTAWLGAAWSERPDRLAALVGIAGAALLFTKVNVGVFLLVSAGLWWWLHLTARPALRRGQLALALLAAALLPVALMQSQWRSDGVATFMIVTSAAGVSIVLATRRGASPRTTCSNLKHLALAAAGVAGITVVVTLAQGTTLGGLIEGWLLQPLRFPSAFLAVHTWRPGAALVAGVSLATAAWFALKPATLPPRGLAWVRIVVATLGGLTLLVQSQLSSQAFCLSYGLSLAWIFVLPLGPEEKVTQPVRSWLALLLAAQTLHAFPVAGSQISWGTFLWIPLAAVGTWEAAQWLATHEPSGTRWQRLVSPVLVVVFTLRCGEAAWQGWRRMGEGDGLGLRGTAGIQVPERTASALRMITRNAQAHGDVVFSLPGLYSFNLWSGRPAPTSRNATHWFTLLTTEQQEDIRRRLEAAPHAVVIVERELLAFLTARGIATETPLTRWLRQEFVAAFRVDAHEFWVRRNRNIPILGTAELLETASPDLPRYRITLTLESAQLANASRIELRAFTGDTSRLVQTWRAFQADPTRTTAEVSTAGATRLHVPTATFPRDLNPDDLYFVVRDAAGNRIAEARMLR